MYKRQAWWSAAKQDLPTQELTDTEEIARLRRLLREREAEIAFLKKAAAYFAKQP